MDLETKRYPHIPVDSIDLFVFSIFMGCHFFIIYYDVKKENITIIDNKMVDNTQIGESNYGDEPFLLRDMLVNYVVGRGHATIAYKLSTRDIQVVPCVWADENNHIDCGVYEMRHMETYTGEASPKWNPEISLRNKKQIDFIRIKYCARICTSDCNEIEEQVKKAADDHYQKTCVQGQVPIDNIVY